MNRNITFSIVLISILVFSELVSYLAMRSIFFEKKSQLSIFNWTWCLTTLFLYTFLFLGRNIESNSFKNYYFNFFMMILITKFFISFVFFISFIFQYIREFFISSKSKEFISSRRSFAGKLALGLASIPFSSMIWGIVKTAYDFKVHKVKIQSSKLPESFKGFRIVQISDIHTGSLQSQLEKAVDIIKSLKADLIVFTGDLVNNQTNEAFNFKELLADIKAPFGVYSILGNHDYGDYYQWENENAKNENFTKMLKFQEEIGWNLLRNENRKIEKNGEFISIIGLENWGANLHFKKYGDLNKAMIDVDVDSFQVLLSHDPSHWSHEVSLNYKKIDLTLSGHTHGFQFGIEIPGFKWSPSKYIYPQWAGLYMKNDQYLYVNRGLGCLGYMGRIGIKPEITLIELS
jgi:uncharacterized protein